MRPPTIEVGDSGGGPIDWGTPVVEVVEDEVESVRTAAGLTWTVRHHVSDNAWTVRGVLAAAEPVTLGEAHVRVAAGAGAAWVWAAGSIGLVALADQAQRPVALRLRRGRLLPRAAGPDQGCPAPRPAGDEADGFTWLASGAEVSGAVVVEFSATRCESWSELHGLLPAWLPTLAVPTGDRVVLSLPDDAVTGADVVPGDDGEVWVGGPGRRVVRIEGVSGELALTVDVAPPLGDCLRLAADRIDAQTGQGTFVRLDAEVLAAQVLVLGAAGRVEGDAYDLLSAELAEREEFGPLATVALARGAVATPERWLVDALGRALGSLSGSQSRPILKAVLQALVWSPEVAALVRDRLPEHPDAAETPEWLAAWLGAGLPGQSGDVDDVTLARFAAYLAAADEPLDPTVWPIPAPVIVEHTTRRLLAGGGSDACVLAWLLVGAAAGGSE